MRQRFINFVCLVVSALTIACAFVVLLRGQGDFPQHITCHGEEIVLWTRQAGNTNYSMDVMVDKMPDSTMVTFWVDSANKPVRFSKSKLIEVLSK